jgi:hypothetical protein
MRILGYILVVLFVTTSAMGQQINPVPDYIFRNQMSVGRNAPTDTAAYLSIGPRYGANKGLMPPMVVDTNAVTGTKRNGLLIFSVQLNNFAYWDSTTSRFRQITAQATVDSLVFSTRAWRQKGDDSLGAVISVKTDTALLSTKAYRQKAVDSLVTLISTLGGGTVLSVGSGYGTNFSTITTSGNVVVDSLVITSRASRDKLKDSLNANIALKVNISDTSTMLGAYLRKADTTAMLTPYLRKGDTTAMLSPYVRIAGYGLLKGTQTLSVDSALMATRARVQKGIDSVASLVAAPDSLLFSTRAWRQKGDDSLGAIIGTKATATGTTNYLSKFTGTSSLGNSIVYATTSEVGISTPSPTHPLDVNGRVRVRTIDSTASPINFLTTDNDGVIRKTTPFTGTVSSVATGFGLSGGTITTTGTLIADTNSMATRARVQKAVDSLNVNIAAKGSGTVTSVSAGTGMSFTTITTTGSVSADTVALSTRAWRQKGIDSVAGLISSSITGSGVSGYMPEFSGTNTLDSTTLFHTSGRFGIGTTSPLTRLHVNDEIMMRKILVDTVGGQATTSPWRTIGVPINFSGVSHWHGISAGPGTPTGGGDFTFFKTRRGDSAMGTGEEIWYFEWRGKHRNNDVNWKTNDSSQLAADYVRYNTHGNGTPTGSRLFRAKNSSGTMTDYIIIDPVAGDIDINGARLDIQTNLRVGDIAQILDTLKLGTVISGNSTSIGRGLLQFASESFATGNITTYNNDAQNFSILNFLKARGTAASATAVQSGDVLGQIGFDGFYDATLNFPYRTSAAIRGVAQENFTSTAIGSYLQFLTASTGTISVTEKMRLNSAGELLIGGTSDQGTFNLQVFGNIYSNGNLGLNTTNPTQRLHVVGNMVLDNGTSGYIYAASGEMLIGEDAGAIYIGQGFGVKPSIPILSGTENTTRHDWFTGSTTARLRLNSSGELLVGGTTDAGSFNLQVQGNIYNTTGPNHLNVTSGNTGIGLSVDNAPSEKLHVNGRVRIVTIDSSASPNNMLWADVNGVVRKAPVPASSVTMSTDNMTAASGWTIAYDKTQAYPVNDVNKTVDGSIATVTINTAAYRTTATFNTDQWVHVATVPSGFRPNSDVYFSLPNTVAGASFRSTSSVGFTSYNFYQEEAAVRVLPNGNVEVFVGLVSNSADLSGANYVIMPISVTYNIESYPN